STSTINRLPPFGIGHQQGLEKSYCQIWQMSGFRLSSFLFWIKTHHELKTINMDISSPSLQEIRDMDLVNYLASLGHEPQRIRGNDFWYHSPLRQERVPSFKVNRRMNRWYDFGLGQGGNLIDFAILHQDCSVGELLASFARPCATSVMQKLKRQKQSFPADHKLEVSRNVSLRSDSLLDYLRQRRISVHIADLYCREIHYRIGDKQFFSIGFPNRSGGFELRNAFFKGSSSPKDISVFSGLSEKLLV